MLVLEKDKEIPKVSACSLLKLCMCRDLVQLGV